MNSRLKPAGHWNRCVTGVNSPFRPRLELSLSKHTLLGTLMLAACCWGLWVIVSLMDIGDSFPDARVFSGDSRDDSGLPRSVPERVQSDEPSEEVLIPEFSVLSRKTMPALPTLGSPRIPDLIGNHPAKRLANEPDDPGWSRPMEDRIVSEIQRREGFPVVSLKVVCRASTCGLIYASKDVRNSEGSYNRFARLISETFGFDSFMGGMSSPSGGGIGYTYIYIGNWGTNTSE